MNREERRILIRQYANQFIKLENLCQQGVNVKENQKKMTELAAQLTMEELLVIDNYIISRRQK